MNVWRKSTQAVNAPGRLAGSSGPDGMPGLVGWYDARDLPTGSVTSWAPRVTSSLGTLFGTGTKGGIGNDQYVDNPRFESTATTGITKTMDATFAFIGFCTDLGRDIKSNTAMCIGAAAQMRAPTVYNYQTAPFKLQYADGVMPTTGITPVVNTKNLYILKSTGITGFQGYLDQYNGSAVTGVFDSLYSGSGTLTIGFRHGNIGQTQWTGRIYAALLYNRILSDLELAVIRQWAALTFSTNSDGAATSHVLSEDTVTRQGVVNWMGTQGYATAFATPTTSMTVSASSVGQPIANSIDRGASVNPAHTNNENNAWMKYDLGASRTLKVDKVYLQQRTDFNGHYHSSVTVQGSNDDSGYVDLATANGLTQTSGAWNVITVNSTTPYRYIRLRMNGYDNLGYQYFVVQEVEFFGTLTHVAGGY